MQASSNAVIAFWNVAPAVLRRGRAETAVDVNCKQKKKNALTGATNNLMQQ
jgi:hypothetical protein